MSDFFVLNDFQPEGIDGKNLQLEFENHKVLMAGGVGREILTKCDNGGLHFRYITPSNLIFIGILEFSNPVTIKKNYRVYLKLHNQDKFEILGNEEDALICPFIWNAFQIILEKN